MPSSLGSAPKLIFEHTPEAHKLRIEFTVRASNSVKKGDAVVLHTDGTVYQAAAATELYKVIGYAMDDQAAGELATIAMRAFCVVVNAEGNAAVPPGPCQLGAWNATTLNREYGPDAGASAEIKDTLCIGHNLINCAADGGAMKVALL